MAHYYSLNFISWIGVREHLILVHVCAIRSQQLPHSNTQRMNKSTRSLLGIARLPILKSDSGEAWLHNGDGDGEFLDLELFLRQGRQLHVNTPAYHKVRTSTSSSKVSFRWWSPMRSDDFCRSLIQNCYFAEGRRISWSDRVRHPSDL